MNVQSCYAELADDRLVVGNALFRREWRVENGLLYATSFRDLTTGREWLARPASEPAPCPAGERRDATVTLSAAKGLNLPREPKAEILRCAQNDDAVTCSLTTRTGRFGPTEAESLVAELLVEARGQAISLVYRFQIFPAARGVVIQLSVRKRSEPGGAAEAENPSAAGKGGQAHFSQTAAKNEPVPLFPSALTGGEVELSVPAGQSLPACDSLELLDLAETHLRLTQVVFADVTDVHNELVQEREWLLHPNEAHLALAGNLFIVESTLSGDGLIFLKHAALPDARPIAAPPNSRIVSGGPGAAPPSPQTAANLGAPPADLRVHGKRAFSSRIKPVEFAPGHPRYPLAFQFGFYGHGACPEPSEGAGEDGHGNPFITLCYSGGAAGRTAALGDYQRQLRDYQPGRDGLFLSNTWGDRSQDSRISEPFLAGEIAAAERLGVDVVQIDDGWQRGRTLNSTQTGGIWRGFWASDSEFWAPHPQRLPNGLGGLAEQTRRANMQFGLWFCPDSSRDYANWRLDADKLLEYHRTLGVNYYKLDGVEIATPAAEGNFRRLVDAVLAGSGGAVVMDLDVTAGQRPGYWGLCHAGPLFVENRYTDWHGYWPHQTLRNLWKLAGYIDPLRLRMEFLNNARNEPFYACPEQSRLL